MTKRRDKVEIARDILDVCIGGAMLTKILRIANLQYNSFDGFMEPLVSAGYIDKKPAKTRDCRTFWEWATTSDGLGLMREIEKMLDKVGIR